ncbi:transcription factor TGA2.1-like [Rutidosis leptorrhynchoides]|uniref:transcription factor TGA2.1-like n=1 Tax=Rutidosis leptorrhynchoides TaxID=125765 RepID=UPI003A99BAC7
MWFGGLRPTHLLQLIKNHIDIIGIQLEKIEFLRSYILNEETTLTKNFTSLEDSISHTLIGKEFVNKGDESDISNYANSMSSLVRKLTIIQNFMDQADELRKKALSETKSIVKSKRQVMVLFAIHDHLKILVTLSNMWKNTTII